MLCQHYLCLNKKRNICYYIIQSTLPAGGYTNYFQEINPAYRPLKFVSVSSNVTIMNFLGCKYSSFVAGAYSGRQRFYSTLGILNIRPRLCHRKNEQTPCTVVCGPAQWLLYYYAMAVQSLYGRDNIPPLTLIS